MSRYETGISPTEALDRVFKRMDIAAQSIQRRTITSDIDREIAAINRQLNDIARAMTNNRPALLTGHDPSWAAGEAVRASLHARLSELRRDRVASKNGASHE